MTNLMTMDRQQPPSVDVIIPVYCERSRSLAATLSACLQQTYPISKIFVVDDGSPEPVSLPDWAQSQPNISLLHLRQNQGISAARNAAIARSNARLLACVNTEVLPERGWLATCAEYLHEHANVGACFGRLVPEHPKRLLSRWRMRFQEPAKYGDTSGPAPFAPGHAVLFRREPIEQVGGYDVRYKSHYEDSDLCERMRQAGWDVHYLAETYCVSVQEDTLVELSKKQLRNSDWRSADDYSLARLFLLQSRWLVVRLCRNLLKGRFLFIPIDFAIWGRSLQIAVLSTLRISQAEGSTSL